MKTIVVIAIAVCLAACGKGPQPQPTCAERKKNHDTALACMKNKECTVTKEHMTALHDYVDNCATEQKSKPQQ